MSMTGKGYSSKNATVQCIQVLYICTCLKLKKIDYTVTLIIKKRRQTSVSEKKFVPKRDVGMVLSHEL